jgi:DNA-binding helix-hairpin-helix protein with protein kinase domain
LRTLTRCGAPRVRTNNSMGKALSIQLGPYRILDRLGSGGSAQVYRAEGPSGPVAIKVLSPAAELDPSARARLQREVLALQQVRHPALIELRDHGVDDELGAYLVLPLLAGTTLREMTAGRGLCPEAAIALALPIASAMTALHEAGIVHRDLKPENVMVAPTGDVTVIDLGLAWRADMTRHTDTGAALGSPGYMAPEQIEGRAVDASADVFALGVLLYEWVAGKRPFARARATEEVAAVLAGVTTPLAAADRRCDAALSELVARCLALEPAARPRAAEVEAALRAMVDWCDPAALGAERAAIVAAPEAYVAKVAPLRVRRAERQARAALDEGRPFAALAACDLGLAYAPDHAGLLALVAEVEAATAKAPTPPPARVDTAPAPPRGPAELAAPAPPRRWWRRPRIVAPLAVLVVVAGAVTLWQRREPPPPATPAAVVPSAAVQAEGLDVARNLLSVFDKLMTSPPPAGKVKVDGLIFDLADGNCRRMAPLKEAGAFTQCDLAIQKSPEDGSLYVLRARTLFDGGEPARARADLATACKLGETSACDGELP